MARFLLVRFVLAVFAMLAVTVIIFFGARLTGDPLDYLVDPLATQQQREEISQAWGLDKPLVTQYGTFLSKAVRGDFGKSLLTGRMVNDLILARLPATLELALVAISISTLIAVPLGVTAAVKANTSIDTFSKTFAVLGQSIPIFWLGIILIFVFSVLFGWFPPGGRGGLESLILPGITMGWFQTAGLMRLLRSGMLEVLGSEYITMARIKGVSRRDVIWKHALRNACIPAITFAAIMLSHSIAGSVITETVFAWPGIGALAITSLHARDFPVVQAIVLFYSAIFLSMNLIADILYGCIDPRIRYTG
ncbi:ABC transporter permease [Chloroflexota bacterium]